MGRIYKIWQEFLGMRETDVLYHHPIKHTVPQLLGRWFSLATAETIEAENQIYPLI